MKKNKKIPKPQQAFSLNITPLPLIPHIEGKRNKRVVVTRIPMGTDITKRDLALQKAQELSQKIKNYR